jgi:hypothetical protein
MTSLTQLPPWITPTLPPAATPTQPGTTTETLPSGLIVVRNELSQVSAGSKLVIPSGPLTGNGPVDAAKAALAELAEKSGPEAAEIMLGSQVQLAQRVRTDEINRQAIEALLAGNAALAAEIMSQYA